MKAAGLTNLRGNSMQFKPAEHGMHIATAFVQCGHKHLSRKCALFREPIKGQVLWLLCPECNARRRNALAKKAA